jgi:hypothetical protein
MAAAAIGAPLEGPEAMYEVKHIDQRVRHRDHPIHPRPAFLQGLEDDEIRPEIDPIGSEPQGFG